MSQKWKVEKIYLKKLANNKWKANNENKMKMSGKNFIWKEIMQGKQKKLE